MATSIQVVHIEKRVAIAAGLNRHITRQQFVTEGETRQVAVWVPDNADPTKTNGNVELVSRTVTLDNGKICDLTLQQAVNRRIREAGIKPRKGQATCLEMILSGSHDRMVAMNRKELLQWAKDSVKWAQNTWGKENVVSASLHVDEKTPHIHLIVVPIVTGQSRRTKHQQGTAKSSRKYNIDHTKLRLCVNEVYTTGKLYAYHDSYAKEVSNKYGMERGERAEPGSKKKHTNSIEYNRMLAVQAAERQALIEELTSDYAEKEAELQEDIQQLQVNRNTLSTAVEEEEERRKEAERKAKEAEEKSKKAEERLSSQEKLITHNKGVIDQQVAEYNARKDELAHTKTDIEHNTKTISDQKEEIDENQQYLDQLKFLKDEIFRKQQELQAMSSMGLYKLIMDIPKKIIAEIQNMVQRYWIGDVTSYEKVQYTVGDGPEEDFAKINIKNVDHEYFIEVREKTGDVYLNGANQPYKRKDTGKEIIMSELAAFFMTELTPEAKQYVESLYKKPTTAETVWESKQVLGDAKIIKNAENDYALKTWDRDFKKWVKVADCVGYSVKSDSTYDYITVTLANGRKEYYNQFGRPLTEKQRRSQGLGGPNTGRGQSM